MRDIKFREWVNPHDSLPDDGIEVIVFLSKEGRDSCQCTYLIAMNNYCDGEGLWMTAQGWLYNSWIECWTPLPEPPIQN